MWPTRLGVNYPQGPPSVGRSNRLGRSPRGVEVFGARRVTNSSSRPDCATAKKLVIAGFPCEPSAEDILHVQTRLIPALREAVIVAQAVRIAERHAHGGIFKRFAPTISLARSAPLPSSRKLVEKTGINKEEIEDVTSGCTNQAGEDKRNVACRPALHNSCRAANRRAARASKRSIKRGRAVETGSPAIFSVAGGVEHHPRSSGHG